MSRKFIPESDIEFLAMAKAFANGLAANPYSWFLSPGDSEAVSRAVAAFEAAYFVANNSATRTVSAVSLKNQTRNSAVSVIRMYANRIRAADGIDDQSKMSVGITPRTIGLTRRRCPQSSPLLKFYGAETGRHGLRYSDSNTPTSPAKPFGAHALQLFMALSDYGTPPTRDPGQARYVGEYGRDGIIVSHEFKDGGKTATYFARWVGARNEHGPWSLPLTAQVMFAGSPEGAKSQKPDDDASNAGDGDLKLAA